MCGLYWKIGNWGAQEDNVLVAKIFRMALERLAGSSWWVSEDVPEILQEAEAGEVDLMLPGESLSNAQCVATLLATAQPMTGAGRLLKASGTDG
jgi:hypothetical protein